MGSSSAGPGLAPFTRLRLETPLPRWSSSLGWELRHHGRWREGSVVHPATAGSVTAQLLAIDLRLELRFNVAFGVRQPVAVITARPTEQPERQVTGLGDTSLYGAYAVSVTGAPGRPGAIRFEGFAGVTLPTGRYEAEPLLSLSTVETGADGGLDLFTHDMRSSPGNGSVASSLGVDLGWQWFSRSEWLFGAAAVLPVTETPDGVSWGSDFTFETSNRLTLLDGFFAAPGVDVRWHLHDRIPVAEADAGTSRVERGGERREVGGRLGVGVAIGKDAACSLRGRLPVWQRAEGVQLMETFSIEATCMVALGL